MSLFVLVTVTFFLTRAIPGSPFQSANVSGTVLEMMETEYGLNEPVWVQYTAYVKNLLHGDLGLSLIHISIMAVLSNYAKESGSFYDWQTANGTGFLAELDETEWLSGKKRLTEIETL